MGAMAGRTTCEGDPSRDRGIEFRLKPRLFSVWSRLLVLCKHNLGLSNYLTVHLSPIGHDVDLTESPTQSFKLIAHSPATSFRTITKTDKQPCCSWPYHLSYASKSTPTSSAPTRPNPWQSTITVHPTRCLLTTPPASTAPFVAPPEKSTSKPYPSPPPPAPSPSTLPTGRAPTGRTRRVISSTASTRGVRRLFLPFNVQYLDSPPGWCITSAGHRLSATAAISPLCIRRMRHIRINVSERAL